MTLKQRLLPAVLGLFLIAALVAVTGGTGQAQAVIAEPSPCFGVCDPPPEVEPPVDTQHSVVVLNVGWDTGDPSTSAKLDPSALSHYAELIRGNVNGFMRDSAGPAGFSSWQVTAGGSFTMAAPREFATPTRPCSDPAVTSEVDNAAIAAARASGVDTSPYAVVVIHYSTPRCSGASAQELNRITLRSDLPGVAIREFAQRLHVFLATALHCTDAAGRAVPLSANCTESDGVDPYDTIGNGSGAFSAIHANWLGWLPGQFYEVAAGDVSRTFFLKPFTDPSHSQRAIRLVDTGGNTLWLEYRQPLGVDSPLYNGGIGYKPVSPGLIVRRERHRPPAAPPVSQLLDMTPATPLADAGLPAGQTWANPLGEMQISLNSATAAGATVTISSQRRPVPNVVDFTRKVAIATIERNGFAYGGLSSKYSCDYIGKVMAQTPAPGTRLMPGTRVSIVEGVRDAHHPCN